MSRYVHGSARSLQDPRVIQRCNVRLDNIALVPASLLPFKDQWDQLVNNLPGSALLVVPDGDPSVRRTMSRIAAQLQIRGRHVITIPAEWFA
ncbi:MAG: hypothetical protein M3Q71_12180 [Chloroflexota bacterium]|nr:hypothetical protein [Chloroflexota bacterium]